MAVHQAALGTEKNGFSQGHFLQNEICFKGLDYIGQCWEATWTHEAVFTADAAKTEAASAS